MADLTGKVAIVTGASRGIGAAAAAEMATAGASVLLTARSTAEIEANAAAIREAGGRAEAMACDVADHAQVEAAVARAVAAFGRLDILVNNAGVIEPIARIAESDPQAWAQVVSINLLGVYHGIRAALPVMEGQGAGVILNLSSGAASSALEGWSHYCATKAAVLSLTRCTHKEAAGRGIRVLGLSPGTVATDMQRAIRASGVNPVSALPWEAHIPADWPGRAIAWLCSDEAADIAGDDVSLRDEGLRKRIGLA